MTNYKHNPTVREGFPFGSADEVPTMERPSWQDCEDDPAKRDYWESHLMSLKKFPLTSPFTGSELIEGETFELLNAPYGLKGGEGWKATAKEILSGKCVAKPIVPMVVKTEIDPMELAEDVILKGDGIFFIDYLRPMLTKWHNKELSISKFVELLNKTAHRYLGTSIISASPIQKEDSKEEKETEDSMWLDAIKMFRSNGNSYHDHIQILKRTFAITRK